MADNVALTQGSGTTFAADDISSVYYPRAKLSLGADGTAVDAVAGAGVVGTGVQRVTLASDDPAVVALQAANTQLPDSPRAYQSIITVTRPANTTAYAANDVVGGVVTFTSIGATAGRIIISTAHLRYNVTAVPSGMTTFRLYLYDATPPSAIADNSAWTLASGDLSNYLGYIDLGTPALPAASSAALVTAPVAPNLQVKLAAASTSLFGYLVTAGAYTPAANSEVIAPTLHSVGL